MMEGSFHQKKILTHVVSMLENGMDILDVGGYSSDPVQKSYL